MIDVIIVLNGHDVHKGPQVTEVSFEGVSKSLALAFLYVLI